MGLKTIRWFLVLSFTILVPFLLPVLLRVFLKSFQLISTCQMLTLLIFICFYIQKKKIPIQSYFYLKAFFIEKISILVSIVLLKVIPYTQCPFCLTIFSVL